MHKVYVVDISSFKQAGDLIRELLVKDTIEGAAVAAAQRIQARADALTSTGRTQGEGAGYQAYQPARSVGRSPAPTAPYGARSNDNKPGGRDLVGHSSVQAWSAGPIFPAVISRTEQYSHRTGDFKGTYWTLHYPGRHDRSFLHYDEAVVCAKQRLNAQRHAPA